MTEERIYLSRWKDYDTISVPDDITEGEWGYLAGLIDGEGSFSAYKTTNTFGVVIGVNEEALIDWLHSRFSGNKSRGGLTAKGNQVYRWFLQRHSDLLYVLPQVRPCLKIKHDQCDAMIALIDHLRDRPTWGTPTSSVTKGERAHRSAAYHAWKDKRDILRQAVINARNRR